MQRGHYFQKKERIAWVTVILTISICLIIPALFQNQANPEPENKIDQMDLDSIIARDLLTIDHGDSEKMEIQDRRRSNKRNINNHSEIRSKKVRFVESNLFNFNPNTIPLDSALLILPKYVAHNLVKYRQKGGNFRQRQDLLKLYGMDSAVYQILEPHIQIPSIAELKKSKKSGPEIQKNSITLIALNDADTIELQTLKGIGKILAKRIIAFRDGLGGFHSIEQLAQTYGLPKETYDQIKNSLTLGSNHHKISVNQSDIQTLSRHPYISWKQARLIAQYRKQHGPIQSITEIRKIRILDDAFIQRITPYLELGDETSDRIITPDLSVQQ